MAVHGVGLDERTGLHYMVQDYVAGGTLRERLAFGGALTPAEAASVAGQVACALVALGRRGIVHRDVKPENILVTETGAAYLTDFGVAKAYDPAGSLRTAANTAFGTPAYVSPEQALDASAVDPRADVWSLGVVLWEMLAGKRPFEGKGFQHVLAQIVGPGATPDVRTVAPAVPEKLARLVAAMCAKRRDRRVASAADVIAHLASAGYPVDPTAPVPVASAPLADPEAFTVPDVAPNDTLSFETTDIEIGDFVRELRRRRRRRVARWALAAGTLVAASAVAAFIFFIP